MTYRVAAHHWMRPEPLEVIAGRLDNGGGQLLELIPTALPNLALARPARESIPTRTAPAGPTRAGWGFIRCWPTSTRPTGRPAGCRWRVGCGLETRAPTTPAITSPCSPTRSNSSPPDVIEDAEIVLRSDSAGATHALLDFAREARIRLSVGFDLTAPVREAIIALPERAWTAAANFQGERDNLSRTAGVARAGVADVAGRRLASAFTTGRPGPLTG